MIIRWKTRLHPFYFLDSIDVPIGSGNAAMHWLCCVRLRLYLRTLRSDTEPPVLMAWTSTNAQVGINSKKHWELRCEPFLLFRLFLYRTDHHEHQQQLRLVRGLARLPFFAQRRADLPGNDRLVP